MIGRTISHYEIVEKLGQGGMGVVYKARDRRLDRYVAIKLLPPGKMADSERRKRFLQEARAASALNHPNIITIHDIVSTDGVECMVMEYVEGRTLAELVPREGMPHDQVLRHGVQIADALAKAHAAGIVHRDLKPGNVMVTGDGLVKLLDFGLAKLTEAPGDAEGDETRTAVSSGPLTVEGAVIGTVSYMSPEQAEGKPVDVRTDVFSFGVLLYEMVTGRRAFEGGSHLATLTAILRDEPPPPSEIAAQVPAELEKIVQRCLRKDPARRPQHMSDLRLALDELKTESESGMLLRRPEAAAAPRRRRWGWVAAAAAVVVLGLAGGGWYWFGQEAAPEPAQQAVAEDVEAEVEAETKPAPPVAPPVAAPTEVAEQPAPQPAAPEPVADPPPPAPALGWPDYDLWVITPKPGGSSPASRLVNTPFADVSPAISPDGQRIAFVSSREYPPGIWISEKDGSGATKLVGGPASSPRWSPDGESIAFATTRYGDGEIYVVAASGGEPRRVTQSRAIERSPSWSIDGKSLYFASNRSGGFEIWKMPVSGGEPVRITRGGGGEAFEAPDGAGLFYVKPRPAVGIYRMEGGGGRGVQAVRGGVEGYWAVSTRGMVFLGRPNTPRPVIFVLRRRMRRAAPVAELPAAPLLRQPGLSLSADGSLILVSLKDSGGAR